MKELGISEKTLNRWLSNKHSEQQGHFLPVEYAENINQEQKAKIIIRGPMGLCIEGMTAQEAAHFFREFSS